MSDKRYSKDRKRMAFQDEGKWKLKRRHHGAWIEYGKVDTEQEADRFLRYAVVRIQS